MAIILQINVIDGIKISVNPNFNAIYKDECMFMNCAEYCVYISCGKRDLHHTVILIFNLFKILH